MAVPYELTANGFEMHWQINHLGPHLLFTSLLPIMLSTAASCQPGQAVRVVNVSGTAAFLNGPKELDLVDPNLKSARGAMACWCVTLCCNSSSILLGLIRWSGAGTAIQRWLTSSMLVQSTTASANKVYWPFQSILGSPRRIYKPKTPL